MSGGDPGSTPASSTKSQEKEENSPASEVNSPETVEKSTASAEKSPDCAPIELPAPEGWTKLYSPRTKAGTPRKKKVVFVAPTGEEIKTRRQLELYLTSHCGGPDLSTFNWGSDDTPRRSGRINKLAESTKTPNAEQPKKRSTKSSDGTKAAKKKKGKEDDKSIEEEESDDEKEMDEANVGEEKKDGDYGKGQADAPSDDNGNEIAQDETIAAAIVLMKMSKSQTSDANDPVEHHALKESKEITEELVTAGDDKTGEGKKGSGDDKGQSEASSDDGKGKEVLLDENTADGKNRNMEEEPNTVGDDKVVEEKKDGDDGKDQADGPSDERGNEVAQDGNIASGQRGKTETSDVNDPVEHHAVNEDKKVEVKEDNKSDQQGDKATTGAAMQIEEEC